MGESGAKNRRVSVKSASGNDGKGDGARTTEECCADESAANSGGFLTIAAPVSAELVEKKSRFIARLAPVDEEAAAVNAIEEIRSAERGARHNPYAYRLHDGRTRYSDDGEPAQTAGRPMLDRLVHAELTDVVAVVTRYFGGVLLGTGGLVRAYSGALQQAIDGADIVRIARCVDGLLRAPYGAYESLRRLFEAQRGVVQVLDCAYSELVTFRLRVLAGHELAIEAQVADVLHATPELSFDEPHDAPFAS